MNIAQTNISFGRSYIFKAGNNVDINRAKEALEDDYYITDTRVKNKIVLTPLDDENYLSYNRVAEDVAALKYPKNDYARAKTKSNIMNTLMKNEVKNAIDLEA